MDTVWVGPAGLSWNGFVWSLGTIEVANIRRIWESLKSKPFKAGSIKILSDEADNEEESGNRAGQDKGEHIEERPGATDVLCDGWASESKDLGCFAFLDPAWPLAALHGHGVERPDARQGNYLGLGVCDSHCPFGHTTRLCPTAIGLRS